MAIDFSLQLPCQVRQAIPELKLRSMVRHLGLAQFAVAKFRAAYPQYDMQTIAAKCTVEIAITGPDGIARQAPVTIGQLMNLIEPLEGVKGHCRGCRGEVSGRSFGCIGKVNYPVPAEAEQWLLARLPEDGRNPGLVLLFKLLADLGIDGAPVEALRARPQIFESRTAATRAWVEGGQARRISSSQLLHMLAFGGDIGAKQAKLFTTLLGLGNLAHEPPTASNAIEQMRIFLRAVVVAGESDASLHVDG